jgi:hypothetical protein
MSANHWVIPALILGASSACSAPESPNPAPEPPSGGAPAGGSAGSSANGGSSGLGGHGGGGSGATGNDGGAAGTGGAAGGGGGQAGSTGGDGGGGGDVDPGAVKDGETQLSNQALAVVSYGGYLNGESFQQDGIITHLGYQYTAFWNTARHVVLARRELPNGAWSSLEFTDYTNTESDAHNTISLGIAPVDGTLHLAFDHHTSDLNYRRSVTGLLSNAGGAWQTSSFSATTDALESGVPVEQVTYPRFITVPGGEKLLMSARLGTSGSGDEYLWEYDTASHTWTSLGKYIDGVSGDVNAYLHGIAYTPGGTRLHAAWCWRETPDASTNHDLAYVYSDDHGRTWKNNAGVTIGTTGTTAIDQSSPGLHVVEIGQDRGLINQEHLTVDALGRVHVLLSHLPEDAANDSNFESARSKSEYFHYLRELDGTWKRTALGLPVVANLRGKLALSSSQNLYAILPDLRIAGAAKSDGYATWTVFDDSDSGRFFSDPLIDSARLLLEDKLSVVYQEKASSDLFVLDYSLK